MLTMDSKAVRFLARMGSRGTLGQAVYDYACAGEDFYAASADLAHASGFDRLMKEFPDRLVDVGIAEQNLVGVSAGLAKTGIPVIATSWATFTSARVADQVRTFMGYMQANVKLVGMDSGFSQSRFSYTHSNPPDIAIMRAIPGITILSPCDGIAIYKLIHAALKYSGPVYMRLTGGTMMPVIYKNPDIDFEIGKSIELTGGRDAAIIATGNIVKSAIDAAALLDANGISVKVIDMHTIQPLDFKALTDLLDYPLVATVEEHLLHGGLGSAIAEFYADKKNRPRHIMMGVDNHYPAPGSSAYTAETNGLSARAIADKILKELQS